MKQRNLKLRKIKKSNPIFFLFCFFFSNRVNTFLNAIHGSFHLIFFNMFPFINYKNFQKCWLFHTFYFVLKNDILKDLKISFWACSEYSSVQTVSERLFVFLNSRSIFSALINSWESRFFVHSRYVKKKETRRAKKSYFFYEKCSYVKI